MPRSKGHPKTGGRKKGTPNRNNVSLDCLMETYSFDPVSEFIKNLQHLSPDVKSASLLKFFEFIFPKRKAAEVSDESKEPEASSHVVVYLPDNKRGSADGD